MRNGQQLFCNDIQRGQLLEQTSHPRRNGFSEIGTAATKKRSAKTRKAGLAASHRAGNCRFPRALVRRSPCQGAS